MNRRHGTLLASAVLVLVGALGAIAPAKPAAADDGIDISVFYGSLAPYGDWVQVQPYGWGWTPSHVELGWHPYTVGYWVWVDPYGWTWISDEPWGWATCHYGRWVYMDDYGWVWLPGTVWAPAWVAFRYGDPWVGWAPLPPGPNWRFDAGFDVAGLNVELSIGTYAWSFVALRDFADTDLRSRLYVSAYNPYLLQRTQWSTRYAPVEGGIANVSLDLATVEKVRGSPVARHRLRDVPSLDKGGVHVQGDDVMAYRPRFLPKAPVVAPPATPHADGVTTKSDLDAWLAQRRAALQTHIDAQRKAFEQQETAPHFFVQPKTGIAPDDAARRHDAAMKAIEEERLRMERLLEQQRLRRMKELESMPPTAPPGPGGGDHGGMGHGHGMK